jgi:hypothetical protein
MPEKTVPNKAKPPLHRYAAVSASQAQANITPVVLHNRMFQKTSSSKSALRKRDIVFRRDS